MNWKLPRVEIVTFGQPRLGNKPFAEFYELNLPKNIRMTHSHDPVVHLPPEGQAGSVYSYHHIATEVHKSYREFHFSATSPLVSSLLQGVDSCC